MVHIWTLRGDFMGTLKQGYQMKEEYYWKFPMKHYEGEKEVRKTRIEHMLEEVREVRDKEMTSAKAEQIKQI